MTSFRATALPALVSRLLCAGCIMGAAAAAGAPALSGFIKWDGYWYALIASVGYERAVDAGQPAWPFFPLLPALLRAVAAVGLPMEASGIVLANLAFWVALAGLHRIARRHVTPEATRLAVWALALFPSSFVFSMLYPSSFYLAASVWAYVWIEEERDGTAALAVLAAALLRPNGVVVAMSLIVALWRSPRRLVAIMAPTAVGVAAWCAYCWVKTGDFIVFFTAKTAWVEVRLVDALAGGIRLSEALHPLMAAAAFGAIAARRRRLPPSWTTLTILQLVPSLFIGMVGMARYANECFPPFVAAGEMLERMPRPWRIAAFTAAICGLFLFIVLVIRFSLIP